MCTSLSINKYAQVISYDDAELFAEDEIQTKYREELAETINDQFLVKELESAGLSREEALNNVKRGKQIVEVMTIFNIPLPYAIAIVDHDINLIDGIPIKQQIEENYPETLV